MSWARAAVDRVRAAYGGPHRAPWRRGLWVTAREDYGARPLPGGFTAETLALEGVPRRLSQHPGVGRPLLVLPGQYARLDEALFVDIAAEATRLGRPVVVLEDRLARDTVRLAGAPDEGLEHLGRQIGALATALGKPDVLALSAGLVAAWSAPPGALHRIVGWSGIRDPAVAARAVRGNPFVARHFQRCHADNEVPVAFDDWFARLAALPRLAPPAAPWLLFHADDDPVVPVSTLDDLPAERVCRLPDGGHLGFGVSAGHALYVAPFLAELGDV